MSEATFHSPFHVPGDLKMLAAVTVVSFKQKLHAIKFDTTEHSGLSLAIY